MTQELKSAQQVQTFLSQVDTFLLDCDGVLWHATTLLPRIKETLEFLRAQNKKLLFVSNNASKSRVGYIEKFRKLGLDWVTADDVIPSSYAAAYGLAQVIPKDKKVFVVGQEGIHQELEAHGVKWTNDCPNVGGEGDIDPSVGAVLVGFDANFNYVKLSQACTYLRYGNAELYASNDDSTFPTASGRLQPGTGCLVHYIEESSDCKAKQIFGKPHQTMMDVIVKSHKLDRKRTCMVGDRLNTDIEFGLNGGLMTLLVLTGVSTRQDLETTTTKPQYLIGSFSHMLKTKE